MTGVKTWPVELVGTNRTELGQLSQVDQYAHTYCGEPAPRRSGRALFRRAPPQ